MSDVQGIRADESHLHLCCCPSERALVLLRKHRCVACHHRRVASADICSQIGSRVQMQHCLLMKLGGMLMWAWTRQCTGLTGMRIAS